MTLSVVLPARNEEGLIKSTIINILRHLKKNKQTFELIVVVNGSSDKTKDIVQQLCLRHKQIKITTSRPGYGYALRKGLKVSTGKFIVIFNVDFYDLHLLDLATIDLYGKDLIIGSKMAHWSTDERAIPRKLVSFFYNKYLAIVHDFRGSDTHGIKIIRSSVTKKILPLCQTYNGIFDTELVIRTQQHGYKIADFPVHVKEIRPPRFTNRLMQTPKDLLELYLSLKIKTKNPEQFYNSLQPKWEKVINNSETNKRLDLVFNHLLKRTPKHNRRFLEVGCGLGYFSKTATELGFKVTGVDIGTRLVAHCQKNIPKAKFITASAHKLPFKDKSFDLLLSTEVIEHLPEKKQKSVIQEFNRVLRPGGTLILTTPNRLWLPVFAFLSMTGLRPYHGIENWFWPNRLINQVRESKFRIKHKFGFNFSPFINPSFTRIDQLLSHLWFLGINFGLVAKKA